MKNPFLTQRRYPARQTRWHQCALQFVIALYFALAGGSHAAAFPITSIRQPEGFIDRVLATVIQVRVPTTGARGSGAIITPTGHILTTYHVIATRNGEPASSADIYIQSDPYASAVYRYVAEFVTGDAALDLAILKITTDPEGRPVTTRFEHIPIGDFRSPALKLADELTTWGYTVGSGQSLTVFRGVVTGFRGDFDPNSAPADIPAGDRWITTDIRIASPDGIAGGAALDRDGVLIGVPALGVDSLLFLRPAIYARDLLRDIPDVAYVTNDSESDPDRGSIIVRRVMSTPDDLIRAAAEGGTIRLAPGVYRIDRTLEFRNDVELIGSGRNDTIIRIGASSDGLRFPGTGTVTINGLTVEREAGNGTVVRIMGDYLLNINETRFTGAKGGDEYPYGAAVILQGNIRGRIESSTFDRNTLGLVVIDGPPTLEITGNVIQDNERQGVWLQSSASVLANNDIIRNGWSGVLVTGSRSPIIRGNSIEENQANGIRVGERATPTLENNDVRRNTYNGIGYFDDAAGTATGNSIEENRQHGIYVSERAAPTLQNNDIRKHGWSGIRYIGDAAGTATGNTTEENQNHGIGVSGRAAPVLLGNIIGRNALSGISYWGEAAGTANGNTITGNQQGIACGDSARAALLRNTVRDNPDYGIGIQGSTRCIESGNTMTGNGNGNQVVRNIPDFNPLPPCTNCIIVRGSIDREDDSFTTPPFTATGNLQAWLIGPADTDFDLYLEKRLTNGTWLEVDYSRGFSNEENIDYVASEGSYRWRVHAYSGAGDFTLYHRAVPVATQSMDAVDSTFSPAPTNASFRNMTSSPSGTTLGWCRST
jgi:parallel beta-helix repeat protein